MNIPALKAFAPAVRRQLIEAVTLQLNHVLTARTPDYLDTYAPQVRALRELAQADRAGLIERVAYTWFNRLTALRFLDARGWHPFGSRVLTPETPAEKQPELLKKMRSGFCPEELHKYTSLDRLNGLLDGHIPSAEPQGEVYRHLVLAACRFYHALMPNLFERLDDETELLLPDDLLTEQSVVQGFRKQIDDDDCSEVEVIGWLYQFYISEKKDKVMARKAAVPTEDIPAVTQLFTPHWIVRYLVENSLGRLWLLNRPESRLRAWMPYYIEREPETEFVRIGRPQDLKVCDPAAGSGHMLTYAFDLLYFIYEEEGYSPSDIPGLILQHNIWGLEIDCRAAQLAALALTLKAREKAARFFQQDRFVQPNVIELRDIRFSEGELVRYTEVLSLGGLFTPGLLGLLHQFEEAKNFGSLIQPCLSAEEIGFARGILEARDLGSNLFLSATHWKVLRVLDQADTLTQRYHVLVANPPYMGSNGMNGALKVFIRKTYPSAKSDLMTCFMERAPLMVMQSGYWGMIDIPSWMFLGSFKEFRRILLRSQCISSLLELGRGIFGSDTGSVAFTVKNELPAVTTTGLYRRLFDRYVQVRGVEKIEVLFLQSDYKAFSVYQSTFLALPGTVIAYWLSSTALNVFNRGTRLEDRYSARSGVMTGDDDFFLRSWHEVSLARIGFGYQSESQIRPGHAFFPMNKEDGFRKWSGCFTTVLRYIDHGREHAERTDINYRLREKNLYFQSGISWSDVTNGPLSFRYQSRGVIFAARAPTIFSEDLVLLAFLNSKLTVFFGAAINPTLSFNLADLYDLPLLVDEMEVLREQIELIVGELIDLSRQDWDAQENSWDFGDYPLLRAHLKDETLSATWSNWGRHTSAAIARAQELEAKSNGLLIQAYGLQHEITPEVSEGQITLMRGDRRRDMVAFLSYAVACMMGRYSLDHPGLILADAGDTVFNYLGRVRKSIDELTFVPDEDGILPVLDGEWFEDDIVARAREFLRTTFGEGTLRDNLRFIEDSLGRNLRNYFLTDFYKDHLQTYKKRPIYWMVQSPRKGFSVLIYLHRYTRDTMNLVLNRYLREYQVKLRSRIAHLAEVQSSGVVSTREKTAARKEFDKLTKILHECEEWERQVVLPLAQARIELDLDDGVKVNYLKLGEALAPIPGLAAAED